jgi:CRISPR-associated protein Cmr6
VKKFEEGIKTYQPNEDILHKAKAYRYIFGTTEHGGHVVFFDAIPSAVPKLELDIINPHYPDYYKEGSKEFPTNWQNPIPVKFLAVAPGSAFRFAIGWRRAPIDAIPMESIPSEEKRKEWSWFKGVTKTQTPNQQNAFVKQAQEWLKKGLLELGAGGKTSAGYGYFKE